MPERDELNARFGVYRSLCCGRELMVREGEKFPDCPNHRNLSTIWKFVETEIVQLVSIDKKPTSDD